MDAAKQKGLVPEQKRLFYQMYLSLAVGMLIASLLHSPFLLIMMMLVSWTVGILTYRVSDYVAITRSVIFMGLFFYVFKRFIFRDLP